jgi:hypothetical protein
VGARGRERRDGETEAGGDREPDVEPDHEAATGDEQGRRGFLDEFGLSLPGS